MEGGGIKNEEDSDRDIVDPHHLAFLSRERLVFTISYDYDRRPKKDFCCLLSST